MENLHDWINTGLLTVFGVLFFMQKNILEYMKTAMQSINPKKIKESLEIIEKGKEYENKLILSKKIKEATTEASARFQEVNKDFLEQYNELINFPFLYLRDKDWQFRERELSKTPKNTEVLRAILEAYDKGVFPAPEEKA